MAIDNYNDKMQELLAKWKNEELHKNRVFNEDGIVCPEEWFSKDSKRILFIFKEAYHKDFPGESYSLTKELFAYSPWKMWNRVAEWTNAIQNTTQDQIAKYYVLNEDEKHSLIRKIAAINIKKSDGKSVSDSENLKKYVECDKDHLKEQIEIIDPQIIVCGNTFEYLDYIYDGAIDRKKHHNDNWYYKLRDITVLDYYHPANQFPSLLNYYGLACIYQQSLIDFSESREAEK